MGQQTCYLCCKNSRKNKDLTFHKFPKDSGLCQKWKEVCGLDTVEDVSGFHICSDHFHEDIKKKFIINGKKTMVKLEAGSVPSISVPFSPQLTGVIKPRNSSPDKFVDDTLADNNEKNNTVNKHDQLSSVTFNDCQEVALSAETPDVDTNARCNTPVNNMASAINDSDDTLTDNDEKNNTGNKVFLENNSICKKRRRHEPLYTKEIQDSDFSTPKRRRRAIQMILKENENQSVKIRSMSKEISYYKTKVKCYKELIAHLKNQNLISRQMELSMMVN